MTRANRRPSATPPVPAAACESLESRRLLSAALLKDVNPRPYSFAGGYTPYHDALYFVGWGTDGGQLYRTSGVPGAPAELVRKIAPSQEVMGPAELKVVGDTLFFSADAGDGAGIELWKSDGTAAGTSMVKDLWPGVAHSRPHELTDVNGKLLFADDRGGLWTSNGTEAGTVPLVVPDPFGSQVGPLRSRILVMKGVAYFATGGGTLWRSDGTPAGTTAIVGVGDAFWMAPLDDTRFLLLHGDVRGITETQLLVSDGTPGGTHVVRRFAPFDPNVDSYLQAVNVDGTVYFGARAKFGEPGGDAGFELWKTDGSPEGTALVADVNPGAARSSALPVGGMDGKVLFQANDGTALRLYFSDGTPAGTRPAIDEAAQGNSAAVSGGKLFFTTRDALYVSDGTPAGTTFLHRFEAGNGPSVLPYRDGVLVRASDPVYGNGLWFSDGTAEGTVRTPAFDADTQPTYADPGAPLPEPVTLGDRALFAGAVGNTGVKLWTTDGTPDGTVQIPGFSATSVPTIRAGRDSAGPFAYVAARNGTTRQLWRATAAGATLLSDVLISGDSLLASDNTFYFAGEQRFSTGVELYRSNGTAGSTTLVKDIFFSGSSQPANFTEAGGVVYFTVGNGLELWKTNGTAAGTTLVKALRPATGTYPTPGLVAAGGRLYFVVHTAAGAAELWTTNGTAAGTTLVKQLRPGGAAYSVSPRVALGDRLYFVVDTAGGAAQLWKTDGSAAGTAAVADIGAQSSRQMLAVGNSLFFTAFASDGSTGVELWKSDGTAAGTRMVKDLLPGPDGSQPHDLRAMGGRLYFTADDGSGGNALWASDGTAAGTVRLTEAPAAEPAPVVTNTWGERNGRMYFTADDGRHGPELWSTDGTPAGTSMVEDVYRGPTGSGVLHPTAAGARVMFFADDGVHGTEPWVVLSPTPTAYVVDRRLFYNNSAFDNQTAGAGADDDAAVAAGVRPYVPGGGVGATAANVSTYGRGINGVMVDVDLLPPGGVLSAADFAVDVGNGSAWAAGPAPTSVSVRRGAGANGSDRVTLLFADNAVENRWLRVTVLPTANTGLAAPDVFAFGSLVGETGSDGRVNSLDLAAVKRLLNTAAAIDSRVDFNHDGRVNALDLAVAKRNLNRSLAFSTVRLAPAPPAPPPAAASPPNPGAATAMVRDEDEQAWS